MITEKVQIIKPIDYEGLRLEAMKHIAKLSSSFWTDYNTHDPGVTIMEILCFALTELGLRANLPLNDIIAEFLNKQEAGFYASDQILTNKPLTVSDYRKLLIDIDGVKNAWLSEIEGHHSPVYKDGKNKKLTLMSEVETFYHLKCNKYETVPDLTSATNEKEKELKKFLNLKFNNSDVLLTRINFREIFQDYPILDELRLYFSNQEQPLITITKNQDGKLSFDQDGLNGKERFGSFYDDKPVIDCQYDPIREPNEEKQAELQDLVASLKEKELDLLSNDFWQIFNDHELLKSLTYIFAGTHEEDDESVNDYLKVFKDVNGALCFSSHDEDDLVCRGYYRIDVELEEGFPKEQQEEKLAEIRSRLNQNRNLCELFPVINIVEDEFVCVCFDIEVAPDANVEDVMSEVVYRLDKFISPDVHFYSLEQMKEKTYKGEDRHYVVEDIFNGPLLRNGFIDDQELAAALPKEKLHASDLIQEIMNVNKVLAVKQLTMSSFHPDNNRELYPVKEEDNWELRLDVTRSTKLLIQQTVTIDGSTVKDYSSKFVAHKGNLPYYVSPHRLLDNVRVLKAKDLPLPFTSEDLTEILPTGRKLDLDYYYSIRNHFPMNYALKDGELEDSASNERKAKVMQLRAFLLFFDQLLANSFKQLSKLGQLLSFEHIDQTYFTQISESGEALKALLSIEPEAYLAKVQECTESKYLFDHRRNRFLNHILARFAEEFHDYLALVEKIYGDEAHQRLIKDKERVLRNIVPWSCERACAENIMVSDMTPMNLSGLEYRFRIFLGMAVREFQDCSYKISTTESGLSLSFFDEDKVYLMGSSSELDGDSLKEIAKKVLLGSTIGEFEIKQKDSGKWFYRTRKTYPGSLILESPNQYESKESAWQGLEECIEFFIIRAKYKLSLNQSNISLYEESGSDGNISYGFTITDRQGEFLKSNPFASENERRSAIEDFLANLELLRSSMDKEKKHSIENVLDAADHLDYSDLAEVLKIIESLIIVEKIQTGNTWTFRLSMELDVTIVLNSMKNFNSEYDAEIALCEAVDFLLDFNFIDKMFIIEHILLLLANSDPKQLFPVSTDSHGEKAAVFDPFSFRITLVLSGETELLANMEFRRYLEKSIREATPSHIFPKICLVSDEQMVAFETAYTNWRDAYLRFARHSYSAGRLKSARRDAAFPAEHLNKARADLINILNGLETIYYQAVLGSSTGTYLESDKNPLVLGQAKLGTLNGE